MTVEFVQLAMRLYTMDAWVKDTAVLLDEDALRNTLRSAAQAGAVSVLAEEFHVFPNGAVTGVLLLAQSHLSIHIWPELRLANVDLLTYGDVDGDLVLETIRVAIGAERTSMSCVLRGVA